MASLEKGEVIAVMGKNKGLEETQFGGSYLHFEDCHLRRIEELKEFKAEFEKETGILKIKNFGYDLEVKVRSPEGELLPEATLFIPSVKYYETLQIVKVFDILTGLLTNPKGPRPGEYSVLVREIDNKNLLYEEKFSIGGPEKAKMEIEIQGSWEKAWEGYEYYIKGMKVTFVNSEKIPIIIRSPHVGIYKDDTSLCSCSQWFGELETTILQPGENKTYILTLCSAFYPVTTDAKGGEYKLTLKIYIRGEIIKELETTLKVPPLS
ncbi:hypothetical protein D6D85_04680 [Candidatus Methanodesulfokora washburnensis]|uniref:Uncharacterized protein n=1 Tax=Candidatus Methanodesulfokora washburnensis TaxID=2478471 RepID=A0A429GQR8_9CREN|nr:hypothetical protein D6D85_04680 [Candidatus Methanodesulfokores washburnensis]